MSGGCQSHLSSLVLNQMLSNGAVTAHLETVLIPTYSHRYKVMVDSIRRLLIPLGVQIMVDPQEPTGASADTAGGFFLYITFPQDGSLPPADEIAKFALDEYNLRIAPGNLFTVMGEDSGRQASPGQYLSGARLCWAWHEELALEEGIQRLREVLIHLSKPDLLG